MGFLMLLIVFKDTKSFTECKCIISASLNNLLFLIFTPYKPVVKINLDFLKKTKL